MYFQTPQSSFRIFLTIRLFKIVVVLSTLELSTEQESNTMKITQFISREVGLYSNYTVIGRKLYWVMTLIVFSVLQPRLVQLGHPPINGEAYPFQQTTPVVLYTSWWMSSLIYFIWSMAITGGIRIFTYVIHRLSTSFHQALKREEERSV